MYGGQATDVTVEFDDSLIGTVQDKFGKNANIMRTPLEKCIAYIQLQVRPTFGGWVF